ncbi:MarR family transcriptional regulator [Bacillus mycoides]|uniref:MarR family transcriptional regulator n=2 Tax=Bacillus TaxID=1386 RepID=A0A109GIW8_BACMY|nr:MarR family transcriptional regulator [Bacillus mycoides]PEK40338.1 MarR family transcriptional regulator [Bacillus toyonensis]PEO35074.1 MarR family transcriptional regulator [Bacillus toyonensis]
MQLASKYEKHIDNQLTAKQVLVLELIRSGVTSTKDLADSLNVSTSAVSQLLNKLEVHEYIIRTIDKENRRKIKLQLTEKSEKYFEKMILLEKEMNENLYGLLPIEDLQHLARILEQLTKLAGDE